MKMVACQPMRMFQTSKKRLLDHLDELDQDIILGATITSERQNDEVYNGQVHVEYTCDENIAPANQW